VHHTVASVGPYSLNHRAPGTFWRCRSRRLPDGSRLVEVDSAGGIHLDAHALRSVPPAVPGAVLVEDLSAYRMRAQYLVGAGRFAAALMGSLGGHALMSSALGDARVVAVTGRLVAEARAGLTATLGTRLFGRGVLLPDLLRRYGDPDLGESVEQVACDPGLRLAAGERVLGPARLALGAGMPTPALALVGAAALEAHGMRPGRSSLATLSALSGLSPHHDLVRAVCSARAAGATRSLSAATSWLADQPTVPSAAAGPSAS